MMRKWEFHWNGVFVMYANGEGAREEELFPQAVSGILCPPSQTYYVYVLLVFMYVSRACSFSMLIHDPFIIVSLSSFHFLIRNPHFFVLCIFHNCVHLVSSNSRIVDKIGLVVSVFRSLQKRILVFILCIKFQFFQYRF